jgi:hypothetical protein
MDRALVVVRALAQRAAELVRRARDGAGVDDPSIPASADLAAWQAAHALRQLVTAFATVRRDTDNLRGATRTHAEQETYLFNAKKAISAARNAFDATLPAIQAAVRAAIVSTGMPTSERKEWAILATEYAEFTAAYFAPLSGQYAQLTARIAALVDDNRDRDANNAIFIIEPVTAAMQNSLRGTMGTAGRTRWPTRTFGVSQLPRHVRRAMVVLVQRANGDHPISGTSWWSDVPDVPRDYIGSDAAPARGVFVVVIHSRAVPAARPDDTGLAIPPDARGVRAVYGIIHDRVADSIPASPDLIQKFNEYNL